MAGRYINNPIHGINLRETSTSVRWVPNGTSPVTTMYGRGVAKIEYVQTGTYRITMRDRFYRMIGFDFSRFQDGAYGLSGGEAVVTKIVDGASTSAIVSSYVEFIFKVAAASTTLSSTSEILTTLRYLQSKESDS